MKLVTLGQTISSTLASQPCTLCRKPPRTVPPPSAPCAPPLAPYIVSTSQLVKLSSGSGPTSKIKRGSLEEVRLGPHFKDKKG